jgi:hypothetical protein
MYSVQADKSFKFVDTIKKFPKYENITFLYVIIYMSMVEVGFLVCSVAEVLPLGIAALLKQPL